MSQQALEAFLARLLTDEALRRAFLANPAETALGAGLSGEMAARLAGVDLAGLELQAHSLGCKRAEKAREVRKGPLQRWWDRLRRG